MSRCHEGADDDPACLNVVLLGVGAVGRELISQIASARNPSWPRVRVSGLVDRSGYVLAPHGFTRRELHEIRDWKRRGGSLASRPGGRGSKPSASLRAVTATGCRPGAVVDLTAADTHEMLERALDGGWIAVLANKHPIAGTQARADRLLAAARRGEAKIFHEATVGAGLPVIESLNRLLESGDRVRVIDACPSGTLGFILGRVSEGVDFSAAVREAMAAGYTEPDPRDDLCGLDVARKALILARMIGFRGDLDVASVESLVAGELVDAPLDRFLAGMQRLNGIWRERVASARSRGAVLRYRARATSRGISVGLAEVPIGSPLGALEGSDNQFVFTTTRYNARPLVISGPGAGAAVTAAGVHGDILRALAERTRHAATSIATALSSAS